MFIIAPAIINIPILNSVHLEFDKSTRIMFRYHIASSMSKCATLKKGQLLHFCSYYLKFKTISNEKENYFNSNIPRILLFA